MSCLVEGACRERHDSQLLLEPTAIDTAMEREDRLEGAHASRGSSCTISPSSTSGFREIISRVKVWLVVGTNGLYKPCLCWLARMIKTVVGLITVIQSCLFTSSWMCLLLTCLKAQRREKWNHTYSFVAPWYHFNYRVLNSYFHAVLDLEHKKYVDNTVFKLTAPADPCIITQYSVK